MELLSPYLAQLGLAGTVFVLLLALLQLGLTQFVKTALQRFAWGQFAQGGVVLLISLVVGGLLGWLMLARVAAVLDIALPAPWGGVVAGLILAATVSGLVSYAQQRAAERQAGRVTPDILAGLIAELAAARTASAAPEVAREDAYAETLRPITPEEAAHLTRTDWPAVPDLDDDAPLIRS